MQFEFLGDYFSNNFQQPPTSGLAQTEIYLQNFCPAELDLELWNYPIDYRHIDPAIESVEQGQVNLQKLTLLQRTELLLKLKQELEYNKTEISQALSLESGRPLWDTLEEVTYTISNFNSINQYVLDFFERYKKESQEKFYFKSSGPALVIGSTSDSFALPIEQLSYLFLGGNSTVFKPSEKHLYSAQLFFKAIHKVGFPEGSLNLLLGDKEMASRLLKTRVLTNVFFSGTTDHGLQVSDLYGTSLLRGQLNLQLGTKNSCIIESDTNIDQLLPNLLKSVYQSSGQLSTRTGLIFVHQSIADELINQFHNLTKKIIIDHPLKFAKEPFMGSLISQKKCDNYIQYMGMAKREGAEEIMRGKRLEFDHKGHYVSPSIHYYQTIDNIGHFLKNELLLPNATFVSYNHLDEAINHINSMPYGLATSLFSKERKRCQEVANVLQVGMIFYNSFLSPHRRDFRFGGDKNSSNFSNIGHAMFEAGLKRVSILEHQNLENIKQLIGLNI